MEFVVWVAGLRSFDMYLRAGTWRVSRSGAVPSVGGSCFVAGGLGSTQRKRAAKQRKLHRASASPQHHSLAQQTHTYRLCRASSG